MNPKFLSLSLLVASLGLPAWAGSPAFAAGDAPQHAAIGVQAPAGPVTRPASTQQVAVSDEARRDEGVGERRLSASELAELRQQVRQQWASAPEAAARAPDGAAAERMMPSQAAKGAATPPPRAHRP